MTPTPDQFEKLATFYLGREYDLASKNLKDDLLLYDAKDLCTHAMCVGMTGSGKTGLCLSLLEEAAIDGIPAICVDPKGDLANLLLTFPDLQPKDFEPWIQPGEATRKGMSVGEFAADRAKLWKKGLASWGQQPSRIQKFRDAVDLAVYTPGSNTGLPLTVLKSFDAPPPEVVADSETMTERVTAAASGLLTLMGIEADPLLSPEHILISSILNHCWRDGRSVGIGDLIGLIQRPPIERVGVLDLDSFMSPTARGSLAMRMNNLLASPAFAPWLEGEPLSIKSLLHTPEGKPRLSILSIAHLSDRERMFFLTILLGELLAWVRTQSGTSSLRALFYMDEVAGYFPPVSNPPTKPPMLTLLKQARAFGLGITLATQNPVDLDYKGLSNIGTWFLGRLQTERDKARVLEGLEGAAIQSGDAFDAKAVDKMLSALGNRVFLMNNVHDDAPTVFQTRWALSYLAGPLARDQISRLMEDRKNDPPSNAPEKKASGHRGKVDAAPTRPVVARGVEERFIETTQSPRSGDRVVYRPAVYCTGTLHYVRASADLDQWIDTRHLMPCSRELPEEDWEASVWLADAPELGEEPIEPNDPDQDIGFGDLPTQLSSVSEFRRLEKAYKDYLYRHHAMTIYKSPLLGEYAPGGSSRGEARVHFEQLAREARDVATEKLRAKYATKMSSLDKKIRTAQERVDREQDQFDQAKMSSMISFGASLLGAFMGRKMASRTNVSKMGTAARSGSRALQQKGDVDRAEEALRGLAEEQTELDERFQEDLAELTEKFEVQNLELDETIIPPRKTDLKVSDPVLVWTPWLVDANGIATPIYDDSERQN